MPEHALSTEVPFKALNATDAGAFLASCIGLSEAIPARRMWALARNGSIRTVRLGRRVFFQTTVLLEFAEPRRSATPKQGVGQ